ncbi:MAG: hypothetical protein J7513_03840 [Solirubrobacteraceae bacterium]|nr:hypothetical protein [Solirubrobacteraceae bacterium]
MVPATAHATASPIPWDGQPGYGYLAQPTDQLGVPGEVAGAGILPDGSIFTPSVEVVPWLGSGDLGVLARRGMPDPTVPVYATGVDAAGADASWWAGRVAGVPSAVMTLNPGARGRAGVALRWGGTMKPGGKPAAYRFARPVTPSRPGLYDQPGQRFRAGRCWKVRRKGSAWVVERGPSVVAVIIGNGKRGKRRLPKTKVTACPRAASAFGAAIRVGVTGGSNLKVIVPLRPIPKKDARVRDLRRADVDAAAQETIGSWRAQRAAGATIKVPEASVQRALDAAVTGMLVPRYQLKDGRWVQAVNKLQYHAFWIRDLAVITDALDRVGLSSVAADNLPFLGDWQTPDGSYVSRPGQGDGFGQGLWVLGQHVRFTGDVAFAKQWAPSVGRAVDWAASQIAVTPTGLLPASDPKDNEYVAGTLTGDQLWGVAGLDAAVSLAGYAGDAPLRAKAIKVRDTLKLRLQNAMRATAINGRIQPTLDGTIGRSWGERWAAWPYPTLPATDPLVQSTVAADLAEMQEGLAVYAGKWLHSYLGFRDWQTLLRAGDKVQPVAGLYASIAHLTATGGGFETSIVPWTNRDATVNLAPHAWTSAELTSFIRDMIVHEEGSDLVAFAAVPSAWTMPGAVTEVERLPTTFGELDLKLAPTATGATLTWKLSPRDGIKLGRLRWPLPPWVKVTKHSGATRDGDELRATGNTGEIDVTWTRQPDQGPTYAGTLAALQGGYLGRGLTPPG